VTWFVERVCGFRALEVHRGQLFQVAHRLGVGVNLFILDSLQSYPVAGARALSPAEPFQKELPISIQLALFLMLSAALNPHNLS